MGDVSIPLPADCEFNFLDVTLGSSANLDPGNIKFFITNGSGSQISADCEFTGLVDSGDSCRTTTLQGLLGAGDEFALAVSVGGGTTPPTLSDVKFVIGCVEPGPV